MGLTLITVLTIKNEENDIRCFGAGPAARTGKWAGWVSLYKDGDYHTDLVSTEPIYASKQDAKNDMERLVRDVRAAEYPKVVCPKDSSP